MATITEWPLASETEAEGLAFAREVLRIEAEALERVRDRLGESIARAADLIYRSTGSVIVTGMGKAGLVGQKLAGDAGLDRHPGVPAPSRRGRARRPRPHPRRRRGDRALAERRDRGSAPPDPGAPAAGRRAWSRSPSGRAARWAGRPTCASRWGRSTRPARWAWPRRPARPCSWPSAMPWRSWSAGCAISPPRTSRCITRRAAWAGSSRGSRR